MRRDADDHVDALGEKRAKTPSRAPRTETRSRKKRAKAVEGEPPADPENATIELITERQGVLGYRYRRLLIERRGRRAQVRELRLQLDYDLQFELATKRRDLARVRGRRLDSASFAKLWKAILKLKPLRLRDHYDFLDSVNPEELDETIGADGEPIAVSTGEEGPACLTIQWGDGGTERKRIVIDRFKEPEVEWTQPRRASRAPLAALCAHVDTRLKAEHPLNHRRSELFAILAEEFESLRKRHFVNLRQFERRIIEAFGAAKDGQAIPLLEGELYAPDSRVRLQALDALAAIGDEKAVPAVSELIYDDETQVREKARRILKSLKAAKA